MPCSVLCESVFWALVEHTDAAQCLCESVFGAMVEHTDAMQCLCESVFRAMVEHTVFVWISALGSDRTHRCYAVFVWINVLGNDGTHRCHRVFCVNQCFGLWWNTQMLHIVCVKDNLIVSNILYPPLKKKNWIQLQLADFQMRALFFACLFLV